MNETILINLNSKDSVKNNGTYNSDIVFDLRGLLIEQSNIISSSIELLNCSIPISYYNINIFNNTLNYTTTVSKTITITPGNYNSTSLLSELSRLFTANSDAIIARINGSSGIITFTSSSAFSLNPSSMLILLGFSDNISIISSVGNKITPPFPLNIASIKQLIIISNELGLSSYSSNRLSNVVISLPVNLPPYSILSYNSPGNLKRNLKQSNIDFIDIKIVDEHGFYIDFNNIDFSISFVLTLTRKQIITNNYNFNEVIKQINTIKKEKSLEEKPIIDETDLLLQN
jgi:hypothetical protein